MKKNLLNQLLILICFLVTISCEKVERFDNGDEIQLEDIIINLGGQEQSKVLDIPLKEISNGWHIYIPSQGSWITQKVVPGKSSIEVSIKQNTTTAERSSYIVIRSKNYTQKVYVNQDSNNGISLSQTYVPVWYFGGASLVNILNYNQLLDVTVTIEESAKTWLSILVENDKININATSNELLVARKGIITVTAKRKISGEMVSSIINVDQGRGGVTSYVIDIPNFSASNVYKVMDGTKQIAQITKEFLRAVDVVNAQAIVVYPVENDIVYLNKGYVAQIVSQNTDLKDATFTYQVPTGAVHGGIVSFSIASNKISGYVAGTAINPVTKVYMPGDMMTAEVIPNSKVTTVEPLMINDVRGGETNTYPIVKIGTQYWMGRNLNTTKYNSSKNYTDIPTNVTDSRAPNYNIHSYVDGATSTAAAVTNRQRYGLLYSYYAIAGGVTSDVEAGVSKADDLIADHISPEGWIVPTAVETNALVTYLGSTGTSALRLRNFIDYNTGQQVYLTNGRTDDNISGFAAPNGSYRSGSNAWSGFGAVNGAWYFTRSYGGSNNVKILNMNNGAGNQVLTRNFSIRCLNLASIKIADN